MPVVAIDPPTLAATILRAMRAHGHRDVPESFIVVEAWRLEPTKFGMRGYESQYPNSKTVSSCLSRMVDDRLIKRVSARTYCVTGEGEMTQPEASQYPTVNDVVDKHIVETLKLCEGNRRVAASLLGIGKRTLVLRLKNMKANEGRGKGVVKSPQSPAVR